MNRSFSFLHALNVTLLALVLAACGDVGNAPQAEIGEAVEVGSVAGETLEIDTTRSEVKWRAAKVTRAHDGGFRTFSGTVSVNDGEISGVHISIDTRSIWSDTDRLTNHLRSPDFFDVEKYPEAVFHASEFTPIDSTGATHRVTGNLTMHGQTNAVTFPAAIVVGDGRVQAKADFIIDRTDWGITYTGQADDLVQNEVRLIFDVVAEDAQPISQADAQQ